MIKTLPHANQYIHEQNINNIFQCTQNLFYIKKNNHMHFNYINEFNTKKTFSTSFPK